MLESSDCVPCACSCSRTSHPDSLMFEAIATRMRSTNKYVGWCLSILGLYHSCFRDFNLSIKLRWTGFKYKLKIKPTCNFEYTSHYFIFETET